MPESKGSETQVLTRIKRSIGVFSTLKFVISRVGPLLILLILMFFFSVLSSSFLTVSNLLNITRQSAVNIVLAVGMTLVIIGGGIDLSVGSLLGLSACTGATFVMVLGINPLLGILIVLAIGASMGTVNGVVITKGHIPDFIATLGMMSVARGLALLITGGLPVAGLPSQITWWGIGDLYKVPVPLILAILVSLSGWIILSYTKLGRCDYAIGGNKEAARNAGIDVDISKIKIYAIMGFFCAIGGLIETGRIYSANGLMGEGLELEAIAAVVIGGTNLFGGEGGVFGSIIGALIMGVLSNGLHLLNVSAFWHRYMVGLIIIVVVVIDQLRRRKIIAE
ncbi:ABC transporter permease [Candidatus Aerophobetes bacterium]|nr:ABC transporter permease [Candidatus Aerophobetes bacterium]